LWDFFPNAYKKPTVVSAKTELPYIFLKRTKPCIPSKNPYTHIKVVATATPIRGFAPPQPCREAGIFFYWENYLRNRSAFSVTNFRNDLESGLVVSFLWMSLDLETILIWLMMMALPTGSPYFLKSAISI
jgi:hypothetical protein